jgi:hypothetical protein
MLTAVAVTQIVQSMSHYTSSKHGEKLVRHNAFLSFPGSDQTLGRGRRPKGNPWGTGRISNTLNHFTRIYPNHTSSFESRCLSSTCSVYRQ